MTTDDLRAVLLAMRDLGSRHGASRVQMQAGDETITYHSGAGGVLVVGTESWDIPDAWIDRTGLTVASAQEQRPAREGETTINQEG